MLPRPFPSSFRRKTRKPGRQTMTRQTTNWIFPMVQCLPKSDAKYIASDLDSYEQYAMINTLEDLLSSMKLKETRIDTPDFIIKSDVQSITLEDGDNTVKGIVAFMESDSCYYTYLIMAVDKAYDANEDVLLQSVLSLKEL